MKNVFRKSLSPPPIREIENVHLPQPLIFELDNGIPVYDSRLGTEDVLKMEMVFEAGRPQEKKRLASRVTNQMLKEGAGSRSAAEIAETVDFYGGTLGTPVNLDNSSVVLFSMKKYFHELLPLVAEVVSEPLFKEEELVSYLKRSKQKLLVDLSKNDVVAYRSITQEIFGESHFYGYNSTPQLYETITRADIVSHHADFYGSNNCKIFISGKTDDQMISLLNRHLGKILRPVKMPAITAPPIPPVQSPIKIDMEGSVQNAIRIGCHLFNRNHPDYCGMFVLNTILGGYFGSRLMASIREEEGYTYNIYSNIDAMMHDGYFYIATEVGNEFVEPTLKQIYFEMERLKNELVGADEMRMVRRYLLGNMLTMLDGPFNVSDVLKTLLSEGASTDHFDTLIQTIKTIQPQEIQALAQKYFQREKMWEVIVG